MDNVASWKTLRLQVGVLSLHLYSIQHFHALAHKVGPFDISFATMVIVCRNLSPIQEYIYKSQKWVVLQLVPDTIVTGFVTSEPFMAQTTRRHWRRWQTGAGSSPNIT